MTILIHLGNQLMANALYQLLVTHGQDDVMITGTSHTHGSTPDVLLVDKATLSHELLATYPDTKVLLMDTGIEPEKLPATLLTYRIHGVLSPHTEIQLFKKALTVVSEGQIWIDNASVRAVLRDGGAISHKGKISHITTREHEVIACICQGLSNKEIAQTLGLSEYTVKAHLNRIFTKLNITSRSKLMSLALDRPLTASA